MQFIFYKHENLLKSDTKIFWWVWSSIPKVLKIASLQCLYNISKNKFIIEFIIVHYRAHYRVHQDQNFYKLDYQFLMKARHVHSTQKRKFVKFLQYIKEKYWNCICVLLWGKTFKYFTGFQSCLLLFVFANIPTVPILPGQSQFLVFSPSVPDWIDLSRFLYFSPKNVHIYIIFHQQCKTIHL